jgi:hypothetical protein
MSLSRLSLLTPLLFVVVTASPARADEPTKEMCVLASEQAQTLRDEGKLKSARAQLVTCSSSSCPGVVRRDCEKWLTEVDAAQPTVVVGARDPRGNDVPGTHVSLDGVPFADRLDGRPLPVDPGEHVFHYDAPGVLSLDQRAVIRVGEKNRMLTVVLSPTASHATVAPPPPAAASPAMSPPSAATSSTDATTPARDEPAPSGGSHVPAGTWVFGGLGVVALGSFAYFGISGKNDVSNLRSTCAPNCAQSDVDSAHTKLVVADVSLGVGVVALGVATWILLANHSDSPPVQAAVIPLPGGAAGALGARF